MESEETQQGGRRHDHWSDHARQWSHVGVPLRPSVEDTAIVFRAIGEWCDRTERPAPTVLLMGVTPELCGLPLPDSARVISADHSIDMIRAIWPGRIRPADDVVCADWARVPLPNASVDVVLGDGALSILQFPDGYVRQMVELRRLLRPGGRCVIRCFASPDRRESVDDVLADLTCNRIGSFHVLKWRLAMALQPTTSNGVVLDDVWRALDEAWPAREQLARRFDWPIEAVRTIDAYRCVRARYTFPTVAEYRNVVAQGGLRVLDVATPSYELGERCPILILEAASC